MEAIDRTLAKQPASQDVTCSECRQPAPNAVADMNGAALCAECAATYYIACAGCRALIPQDEARERDDSPYCAHCFQKAVEGTDTIAPDDEEVEALVIEYTALHSEESRIKKRMYQIKDRLKIAASFRQRVAGAVILRAGEEAVRCGYTLKYKCDTEKVEALESALNRELFASLFERKVSFNAVKENIEEFLSGADDTSEAVREAVRDAIEKVETPTLTVPRRKK